jgi:hypothetical protein
MDILIRDKCGERQITVGHRWFKRLPWLAIETKGSKNVKILE